MTTQFVTQFNKPLRSLCQSASLLTRLATFQCLSLAALRGLLAFSLFLPLTLATDYARAIPSEGHKMMIAAPSPYAVEVGKKVIAQGGNVVDVAVAVGLTLSVTSPYFAGLGGGGFALIKMKDDVDVIDFRETAPAKTSPNYYKDKAKDASITGGAAVGVPGVPAGLWEVHKKYGKLRWSKLFAEPLKLADKGFHVSGAWVQRAKRTEKRFNDAGRKHFMKKAGVHYKPGEVLTQKGLVKALKEFKRKNVKGFYEGFVAKDIVQAVTSAGGDLSLEDLKSYKVRWLKPLTANYLGHKIYLMPPPSSGGVVMKSAFSLLEKLKVHEKAPLSVDELHLMAEVLKLSFRGRATLGDPDFHENPMDYLLSEPYLSDLAKGINLKKPKAMKPITLKTIVESNETTHFSVMDNKGRAVSLTVTLNGSYGSGVVSNRFGIALNNEMDDFTTKPGQPNLYGLIQGMGNTVEPGKRPLSSMSPTLVEKDGKIVMAIGAPGGPRIISGTLQAIYRVLANGWDLDMAIQAPRLHHQFLPDTLYVDRNRLSPDVLDLLRKRGHKVEESWNARVKAVRINEEGFLEAAFDARSEGAAGGF
jgi:gamma-glutamyltranspeptidase/glutathione hydrolase